MFFISSFAALLIYSLFATLGSMIKYVSNSFDIFNYDLQLEFSGAVDLLLVVTK